MTFKLNNRLDLLLIFFSAFVLAIFTSLFPLYTLILVLGIFCFFICVFKPQFIAFSFLIYFPFEEFILKLIPSGYSSIIRFGVEPLLVLLLITVLLRKKEKKQNNSIKAMIIVTLLFLVFSMFSNLINSSNLMIWALGIRPFIRYFALFLITANLSIFNFKRIISIIVLITFIQGSLGILQNMFPALLEYLSSDGVMLGNQIMKHSYETNYSETFIFGTLGRYNIYANFLVHSLLLIIPYRILQLRHNSNAFQNFGLYIRGNGVFTDLTILVSLIALFISSSRMSIIALLACLIFMVSFLKLKKLNLILILIPSFVILILYFWGSGINFEEGSIVSRFMKGLSADYIQQSLKTDRLYVIFSLTPFILSKSFLLGFGPGEVGSDVTGGVIGSVKLFDVNSVLTNPFLSDVGHVALLAQTGVIGYITYFTLFVIIFIIGKKNYKKSNNIYFRSLSIGIVLTIIAISIENFFSFNIIYRPISGYFWLLAGLVIGSKHIENGES